MFSRQPFEPELEIKLKVHYQHPDGPARVHTSVWDGLRDADKMARVYASLETTERVILYMPDGTTRQYLGPEQTRRLSAGRLPLGSLS